MTMAVDLCSWRARRFGVRRWLVVAPWLVLLAAASCAAPDPPEPPAPLVPKGFDRNTRACLRLSSTPPPNYVSDSGQPIIQVKGASCGSEERMLIIRVLPELRRVPPQLADGDMVFLRAEASGRFWSIGQNEPAAASNQSSVVTLVDTVRAAHRFVIERIAPPPNRVDRRIAEGTLVRLLEPNPSNLEDLGAGPSRATVKFRVDAPSRALILDRGRQNPDSAEFYLELVEDGPDLSSLD
ncbi:MAG: hypothetical protein ACFB9M_00530 [Myxococcota bacterium]